MEGHDRVRDKNKVRGTESSVNILETTGRTCIKSLEIVYEPGRLVQRRRIAETSIHPQGMLTTF